MDSAWTLMFAVAVPFLCLGMLLWLARLEDTLTDNLPAAKATREAPTAPTAPTATAPTAMAGVAAVTADAPAAA